MKPQIKRKVAIDQIFTETRTIFLWATKDAKEDLLEFATILSYSILGQDGYQLKIDGRYDFDEVVKYIKNYNG